MIHKFKGGHLRSGRQLNQINKALARWRLDPLPLRDPVEEKEDDERAVSKDGKEEHVPGGLTDLEDLDSRVSDDRNTNLGSCTEEDDSDKELCEAQETAHVDPMDLETHAPGELQRPPRPETGRVFSRHAW